MAKSGMFWDKSITKKEAAKVLGDEHDPRFIEYAALFLSRTNDPKAVFGKFIDKKVFCRQWRRIKKRMRTNKWSDNRIIYWDEIYRVLVKHFDKSELSLQKEKRAAIDPEISSVGEKIRNARKAKGWTQGDLANKSGFSQQTISFIEGGYVNVSYLTLKKIAASLGLSILLS